MKIKSIVAKKGTMTVDDNYPQCLHVIGTGVNERRIYINANQFIVAYDHVAQISALEVATEMKDFQIDLGETDAEKIADAIVRADYAVSAQKTFGDNSDEAVLARAVLNHASVINSNCSASEFRELAERIGNEKGLNNQTINA